MFETYDVFIGCLLSKHTYIYYVWVPVFHPLNLGCPKNNMVFAGERVDWLDSRPLLALTFIGIHNIMLYYNPHISGSDFIRFFRPKQAGALFLHCSGKFYFLASRSWSLYRYFGSSLMVLRNIISYPWLHIHIFYIAFDTCITCIGIG